MKVLFLHDGPQNPSGRFRCEQFFSHFEKHGIECHERYSYGSNYNALAGTALSTPYRAVCRLRRAAWTLFSPGYDLLFFQRTALAFTAVPELLRGRFSTPCIFDFDDAIYLRGDGSPDPIRGAAFRAAVSSATWVIAGNAHLASKAAAPQKTTVLPTVVDTDTLVPSLQPRVAGAVVGWMGTASNFVHLRTVLPQVLAAVRAVPNARLRIVSNAPLPELASEPLAEFVPWSADREVELLQSFDVGLMPLMDAEIARGKCAFKILQYMAVGSAVVASDVGANTDVLSNSGAGILVRPGADWTQPIVALLQDQARRQEMGRAGRLGVVARYSVSGVVPRYVQLFRQLTGSPGGPA